MSGSLVAAFIVVWVVLVVGPLFLRRWGSRRLREVLAPAWDRVAEARGWQPVVSSGFLRLSVAVHWSGECEGHPLRLLAYRSLFSKFSYDWVPRVVLQIKLPTPGLCIVPAKKKAVRWQIEALSLSRTSRGLHRFIGGEVGEELIEGVPELVATTSLSPPRTVRDALVRAAGAGDLWILEDQLVMSWCVSVRDDHARRLDEALADASTLSAWIDELCSPAGGSSS